MPGAELRQPVPEAGVLDGRGKDAHGEKERRQVLVFRQVILPPLPQTAQEISLVGHRLQKLLLSGAVSHYPVSHRVMKIIRNIRVARFLPDVPLQRA